MFSLKFFAFFLLLAFPIHANDQVKVPSLQLELETIDKNKTLEKKTETISEAKLLTNVLHLGYGKLEVLKSRPGNTIRSSLFYFNQWPFVKEAEFLAQAKDTLMIPLVLKTTAGEEIPFLLPRGQKWIFLESNLILGSVFFKKLEDEKKQAYRILKINFPSKNLSPPLWTEVHQRIWQDLITKPGIHIRYTVLNKSSKKQDEVEVTINNWNEKSVWISKGSSVLEIKKGLNISALYHEILTKILNLKDEPLLTFKNWTAKYIKRNGKEAALFYSNGLVLDYDLPFGFAGFESDQTVISVNVLEEEIKMPKVVLSKEEVLSQMRSVTDAMNDYIQHIAANLSDEKTKKELLERAKKEFDQATDWLTMSRELDRGQGLDPSGNMVFREIPKDTFEKYKDYKLSLFTEALEGLALLGQEKANALFDEFKNQLKSNSAAPGLFLSVMNLGQTQSSYTLTIALEVNANGKTKIVSFNLRERTSLTKPNPHTLSPPRRP